VTALLFAALLAAAGEPALFDDGNQAYLAGDPAKAIASYEALLAEGVESPELETNLGAAYLRQGRRGLAALHFERALALAPGDDDARADLAEIRRTNVDKLEGAEEQGPAEIFIRLLAPLPGGAAAIALLVAWSLGWALLALLALRPAGLAQAPLGAFALACFGVVALAAAVTAGSAAGRAIALRRAVVVAASAAAHEGPSEKTRSPFEVHEGTAVSVEETIAGYSRIKLANGLTGWVDAGTLERVVPQRWRTD
jgi:tetratricopeptide (TPR) repeat protein